mgnify:CR=1 FL=1
MTTYTFIYKTRTHTINALNVALLKYQVDGIGMNGSKIKIVKIEILASK